MGEIRVEHYAVEHVDNPNPDGDVSSKLYHSVRNAVLRCCRRFGHSGPPEVPGFDGDTPPGDDSIDLNLLDYFVVDDQYNHERYVYVEVERAEAFTGEWLCELVRTMRQFPGWGVGIMAFEQAYVLAFADRLMVTGRIFATCSTVDCVVQRGRAALSSASP